MPVKPSQILGIRTSESQVLDNLIDGIDEHLRSHALQDGDTFYYPLESTLSNRVKNALKEIYGEAGWQVELLSDQRDGDSIRLIIP